LGEEKKKTERKDFDHSQKNSPLYPPIRHEGTRQSFSGASRRKEERKDAENQGLGLRSHGAAMAR
jgi:hypothetical protein